VNRVVETAAGINRDSSPTLRRYNVRVQGDIMNFGRVMKVGAIVEAVRPRTCVVIEDGS
jgi:hypothetical protein